jgi:hypothetical protein
MIDFIEVENGLEIVLTGTKEEFLEEFPDINTIDPFELLEYEKLIGNDWHDITDRIGLTEAPAIGVGSYMPDGAEEDNDYEEEFERAYYFPHYMVENPWEILLNDGKVFFQKIN